MRRRDTVRPFDDDVARLGGYEYTTGSRLSTRLANERLTQAAASAGDFHDCRVLDIGSGDGEYTIAIRSLGAKSVVGADPSFAGSAAGARKATGTRSVRFISASAYDLPFPDGSFDLGHLRGVLHHLDRPFDALREALRVCSNIIVIEPNGYNPVLKVLERVSPYHRKHEEKSYTPARLRQWVVQSSGAMSTAFYAGLVPMFCPDWMARLLKPIEPLIERAWPVNRLCCAVYVFSAKAKA